MTLDPITLGVIQAGLQQVCDEMDLTFSRAAFSPVIAEADDRSDGIYAARDGALIAQGSRGLPVFVGTMQFSTRVLIERIAAGVTLPPEPGDIYIVNDPYLGGTHLMDVRFATPFWRQGRIFCWLSNTGHWPDTGGMVPGGFSASAISAEQEGLRLPPVKLFKRGVLDPEIYSIITSNIRVADSRIGDVRAQASALLVGAERLTALLDRYGDATVAEAIAEIRVRARVQMQAMIALIPRGIYRGEAFIDSDGVVDAPLTIALAVTRGERRARLRLLRVVAALRRADELGQGDDAELGLSCDAAYLSGGADQRRSLRAAGGHRHRGQLPRRGLSAAGVGLRGGGQPAHRRGGVRGAGRPPARPGHRGAGRHLRQLRARRRGSGDRARVRHVPDLRRRLWRQRRS